MDTRTKIIPLPELEERLEGRAAVRVSGHFDPLLAEHVRRLTQARAAGQLLVVEVTNPAQPLLSQRARAELVSALSAVDFVVMGGGKPGLHGGITDAGITQRFIEHVLERHRQETRG